MFAYKHPINREAGVTINTVKPQYDTLSTKVGRYIYYFFVVEPLVVLYGKALHCQLARHFDRCPLALVVVFEIPSTIY